jgi:hypothetical protein
LSARVPSALDGGPIRLLVTPSGPSVRAAHEPGHLGTITARIRRIEET